MSPPNDYYYRCISRTLQCAFCLSYYPSSTMDCHVMAEVEKPAGKSRDAKGDATFPVNDRSVEIIRSDQVLNSILVRRDEYVCCLIESTINSTLVSLTFQRSDDLVEQLIERSVRFMRHRSSACNLLRREAKPGFDASFLITYDTTSGMSADDVGDFIMLISATVDEDVKALKLVADRFTRRAADEWFRACIEAGEFVHHIT